MNESLCPFGSLTDDERQALARFRRSGVQSTFAFPAPEGCKSLEDWGRDGERRWSVLRSKVYRALPTAWNSPMLAGRS